jgi:hypothetical protein
MEVAEEEVVVAEEVVVVVVEVEVEVEGPMSDSQRT